MSDDRHTMTVRIEDGYLSLRVNCPYDKRDVTRPCWPHDIELEYEDPRPEPAPQDDCVYESWVENLMPDELLHGSWEVETGVEWEWGGDGPEAVRLQPLSVYEP